MEKLSKRDQILLGAGPRDPFGNPNVDYHDVFGGPPRRSAFCEPRRSRPDSLDLGSSRGKRSGVGDDGAGSRRALSGLGEKPVFGEGSGGSRTSHLGDDFYDDIFQGNESLSSGLGRSDRESFGSPCSSRVMSPTIRALTPRSDHFADGSALPTHLSLSAKITKGIEHAISSSPPRRTHRKTDDGIPIVASRAVSTQEDTRMEAHSSYRKSPLSNQFDYSMDGSSNLSISSSANFSRESQSRKDQTSLEGYSRSSRFHFSIYKWAGKGVMLMMPPSSKERSNNSSSRRVLPELVLQVVGMPSKDDYLPDLSMPDETKSQSQDKEFVSDPTTERDAVPVSKEDILPPKFELKVLQSGVIAESGRKTIVGDTSEEFLSTMHEAGASHVKGPNEELVGNVGKQGTADMIGQAEEIDGMDRVPKNAYGHVNVNMQAKRANSMNHNEKNENINIMDSKQEKTIFMEDKMPGRRAKGKVKEFIKIFNQDAPPNPKETTVTTNQKPAGKDIRKQRKEKEVSNTPPDAKETTVTKNQKTTGKDSRRQKEEKQVCGTPAKLEKTTVTENEKPIVKDNRRRKEVEEVNKNAAKNDEVKATREKAKPLTESLITINQILKQAEEPDPKCASDVDKAPEFFSRNNDTLACESAAEMFDEAVRIAEETQDLEACLVEELPQDPNEQLKTDVHQDQIRTSDAKIREWSKGKEGNIRSLLSTLQYILWPESGWRPVPLVDIIEGSSVKRAYQKALLCLHPDKLQQKGAATHQKYIAEKVFDILQEAWDQFNSVSVF